MELIDCPDAPKAIGPYSHAVRVGNLIFCSGQTPLDPQTMKIVGNNIEQQTSRVLENLSIVLNTLDLTLQDVAKTTVYLKSMDDFEGMNKVYSEYFKDHKPSRTTIAIQKNPLDALVEIECVAEGLAQ